MEQSKLNEILEKHKHWINEDCDGWREMKADLRGADLCRADLYGANLYGADLRRANLRGADLRGANLYGADLRKANLRGADLRGANLSGADLRGANLYGADLYGANLSGADLYGANLYGADLYRADLYGAKNIPFIPYACPDFGMFIGFKKARNNLIVVLEIPDDAKRLSATGRKCRCDKARVLEIQNLDGTKSDKTEAVSQHDKDFIYRVGEIVSVPDFCEDRWNECSKGIHFFINRQEAVDY